ncbi:hypothetical protein JL720_10194 [Aureococcus anophagefferens]|nr:hypothetical protein JL720_10194 [Aureococcus anophagefferens]
MKRPPKGTKICVVMFSTYMLFLVYCHGHSPSAIYRALVHSQTLIGACMLGVYFPLLLWLGMIVIASQIYFAFWPKWLCTFAVPLVYAAFHFLFTYSYARAFPRAMRGGIELYAASASAATALMKEATPVGA